MVAEAHTLLDAHIHELPAVDVNIRQGRKLLAGLFDVSFGGGLFNYERGLLRGGALLGCGALLRLKRLTLRQGQQIYE